ncbi:MAG: hypothetical protein JXR76_05330 [Deltaproteobacteria bacterium]|nr:hypothetical protein [Deltaproteobacteria bacterium]
MPESKIEQTKIKEPYEKPHVTFTEIQVEQALMGICRASGIVGPFGMSCAGPCSGGS